MNWIFQVWQIVQKNIYWKISIGAAAGSELEIFQWVDNSFKKIAEVSYYKFFLVNGNKKIGIAVWQIYFGDSYLVDFLKWNGVKLAYTEDLYSKYYLVIVKFNHVRNYLRL